VSFSWFECIIPEANIFLKATVFQVCKFLFNNPKALIFT
jgi:hypothetical protein